MLFQVEDIHFNVWKLETTSRKHSACLSREEECAAASNKTWWNLKLCVPQIKGFLGCWCSDIKLSASKHLSPTVCLTEINWGFSRSLIGNSWDNYQRVEANSSGTSLINRAFKEKHQDVNNDLFFHLKLEKVKWRGF